MGDLSSMNELSLSSKSGLSQRGLQDLQTAQGRLGAIKKILGNLYDPKDNPNGIINFGVADNSLCRTELVQFFTSPGRLVLEPRDLTYADGFFASARVLKAIADLFNTVPDGFYTKDTWTPPLTPIKPEHLMVGNGATEIIEACFWDLCDAGDGVLLSTPYYNAFDEDLTLRAGAKIVPVHMPLAASATGDDVRQPVESFSQDCVRYYEQALEEATQKGVHVRAVLVCNPHNPTGGIYPRETIVALAGFAAKHDLHLVMDEIYARSVFETKDVPKPTQFDSILRIDVKKEAGLDPSRVHVITSASKDFSINGFRIGILISQHNEDLMKSLFVNARFAQTASPAGQLFASLINDRKYLHWYLTENRRRLQSTFNFVTGFFKHHKIPYVPSNAGHFCMIDLRQYLEEETSSETHTTSRKEGSSGSGTHWSAKEMTPERKLTYTFLQGGILISPGAQYHHPVPGFFRFTFSNQPKTLQIGLARFEKVLGLEKWVEEQPLVEF